MQTENSYFAPFCCIPSPSAEFVGNSISPVSTRADDVGQKGDNSFATHITNKIVGDSTLKYGYKW